MKMVRADMLEPGMLVDVPSHVTVGTPNSDISEYEFAEVESVNGGWADWAAGLGQVVVYAPNFAVPIVCPADLVMGVHT